MVMMIAITPSLNASIRPLCMKFENEAAGIWKNDECANNNARVGLQLFKLFLFEQNLIYLDVGFSALHFHFDIKGGTHSFLLENTGEFRAVFVR